MRGELAGSWVEAAEGHWGVAACHLQGMARTSRWLEGDMPGTVWKRAAYFSFSRRRGAGEGGF